MEKWRGDSIKRFREEYVKDSVGAISHIGITGLSKNTLEKADSEDSIDETDC